MSCLQYNNHDYDMCITRNSTLPSRLLFSTPICMFVNHGCELVTFRINSVYETLPQYLMDFCESKHRLIWMAPLIWIILVIISLIGMKRFKSSQLSKLSFIIMTSLIIYCSNARFNEKYSKLLLSEIASFEYIIVMTFNLFIMQWIYYSKISYLVIRCILIVLQLAIQSIIFPVYQQLNPHKFEVVGPIYLSICIIIIIMSLLELLMFYLTSRYLLYRPMMGIIVLHTVIQLVNIYVMMLLNVSFTVVVGNCSDFICLNILFLNKYLLPQCKAELSRLITHNKDISLERGGHSFMIMPPVIVLLFSYVIKAELMVIFVLIAHIFLLGIVINECYYYVKHSRNIYCECYHQKQLYRRTKTRQREERLRLLRNKTITSHLPLPRDLLSIVLSYEKDLLLVSV